MATETEMIRYSSFGDLVLGFLLGIVILAGCGELPGPIQVPYSAAPASHFTAWRPPPVLPANQTQIAAATAVAVPGRPNAGYRLADLIDFPHPPNPDAYPLLED